MSGDVARVTRLVRRVKDGDISRSSARKRTVLAHLRASGQPCRAREVAELLKLQRIPNQLIGELMAEGLLRRFREGRRHYYELDPTHPDNQPEED